MSIRVQDPLFLLSAQTGLSVGELAAKAAAGSPDINKKQEAFKTGEPIPLLFTRFRNSAGGVMAQPKITEGYFANPIIEEEYDLTNGLTAYGAYQTFQIKYLYVLSEGELPELQIRDIFFGNSRVGTFNQKYNGRAGTWTPGNAIDDHFETVITTPTGGVFTYNPFSLTTGQSARLANRVYYQGSGSSLIAMDYVESSFTNFCGTSGTYSGLTTLSFEYQIKAGASAKLDRTLSIFVRKGLEVTRLVDGVTGSSDNFADLVKYLFQKNNRLADDLIDDAALTTAAKFTDANGFLFNGQLKESQNLLDWLQATSVNFLLRVSNSGGKFGLLPRLPYNTNHTIKTTQVTPEFTFTEEHVVEGGFEIEYISLEDREPVCFVVAWRQQPETDFGLVRTVEVRYQGEAASGPFVNIDLSDYCTSEDHAVKVGAFRLAQRKFVTHHLRLTVRERSYNATLVIGDLVRVRLRRETTEGEVEYHDKLYEINRIEKTFASTITYDLTHFPIDSLGRSIVARQVNAASGAGNVINVGKSTFDADENSSSVTTIVGTSSGGGGTAPSSADTEAEFELPTDGDSPFPDGSDNPSDSLDQSVDDTSAAAIAGSNSGYGGSSATPGNTVDIQSTDLPCSNGRVCFYRLDKETGVKTLRACVTTPVGGKFSSTITTADISYAIVVEGQCPDPSSESGYGPPIQLGETAVVVPDVTQYSYVRFKGTRTTYDTGDSTPTVEAITSSFFQYDGTTQDPYVYVGSAWGAFGGILYTFQKADDALGTPPYTTSFNTSLDWSSPFNVPWRSMFLQLAANSQPAEGMV